MAGEQHLRAALEAALRYLETQEAATRGGDEARARLILQLRDALPSPAPPPDRGAPSRIPKGEEARLTAVRDALGPDLLRLAQRSNLSEGFIAGRLLEARAPFSVTEVALECFGMPNKHERERMQHVVEALERAGLLARVDPAGTRWRPAKPDA
ncbi:MAG: hypothetical protein KGM44_08345 [bacterium]|nr:hypothetical protein [bacterium]